MFRLEQRRRWQSRIPSASPALDLMRRDDGEVIVAGSYRPDIEVTAGARAGVVLESLTWRAPLDCDRELLRDRSSPYCSDRVGYGGHHAAGVVLTVRSG